MPPNIASNWSRRTFLQLVAASSAATSLSTVSTASEHENDEIDDTSPFEDVPTAGDFPAGETLGLQQIAAGLPAPTDFQAIEADGESHQFIVTQTGQIYQYQPDQDEPDVEDEEGEEDEHAEEFVFNGVTPGWIGEEPEPIDGVENPTLELVSGETYRIIWVNGDGDPHNVAILDPDDNIIERTEIISESGEEQTLEFEASEDMSQYLCEVHPGTMVGSIQIDEQRDVPEGMELFLDIEDRIVSLGIGELGDYDERGLYSLAFHPEFDENRKFYVRYAAPGDLGLGYDHTDVLAEFEANEDIDGADPNSERRIMEFGQPQDNHNGGQVAFGPDGYLYTSVGDGGNVHDIGLGHVEDWYDENEGGNGQDTSENLLGGIHRIDVDPESDEEFDYEVPDDNPLVDSEGFLDEYYAWGFRNPWGMSIDDDGTIFVSDAGQHAVESVYIVEQGGNYAWNVKEGSFCFSPETPLDPPSECPDAVADDVSDPRGGEPLREPIAEYSHRRVTEAFIDSSVVVGGHRYVGEAIPELEGNFVFANWSSFGVEQPDGEVLVAIAPANNEEDEEDEVAPQQWELEELQFADAEEESVNRYVYSVERDEQGELYLLTNTDFRPFPATGEVYKIVPADEAEEVPAPEEPHVIDGSAEGDPGEHEDDE